MTRRWLAIVMELAGCAALAYGLGLAWEPLGFIGGGIIMVIIAQGLDPMKVI